MRGSRKRKRRRSYDDDEGDDRKRRLCLYKSGEKERRKERSYVCAKLFFWRADGCPIGVIDGQARTMIDAAFPARGDLVSG